jgi:hypothetical protein
MEELQLQQMHPAKIWEPVWAKRVVESINLSHKAIVQYAKDKGLKEVCICEDDLMFTCAGAWEYFNKNKPDQFDIYVGGTYLIDNPESYAPPRIKVDEYVGNHLIVVSERYYDTFLSVPVLAHIDTVHRGLGEFYVCFPMVALQRPGHSSNVGCDVNYNKEIKPEWRYNGAVHNL